MHIDRCSFGSLVIDGRKYTDDLIIHPDGRIDLPWRRQAGHRLSKTDLTDLLNRHPASIIAGTGMSGLMRPDKELQELLLREGVEFLAAPNPQAIKLFNERAARNRQVAACFHLTC